MAPKSQTKKMGSTTLQLFLLGALFQHRYLCLWTGQRNIMVNGVMEVRSREFPKEVSQQSQILLEVKENVKRKRLSDVLMSR